MDSSNSRAIAEICRRLDGIPLAIELAAARVVAMSPREIAARLDERFRLLTGGRRTAVERHQTLRATVDWSYSLLDETERTIFDRLAVFAGSFDARAAQAVAASDDAKALQALMSSTRANPSASRTRQWPSNMLKTACSSSLAGTKTRSTPRMPWLLS